ncbi:2-polyprenyl-6-methoxyphenol hydroxylase-like FAD-dependent oxidoreductase [Kribbella steppae]|uniref:2-polyprenyl-6-methoxyphenol hydroxylase-like FAD-dependent oxidoreductase n=1 Tax=Kribbella steppae TaxID=2512223 RepID=A0A4R2HBH7_9ACTN|nr:FAD-dependent oxidoreductase [Kribbella steppae]TCO24956.1 2-polyprenyl-6-methoxyphenol hydroxylase-like FAD-dependent oxidoreductase [Kribbella steppae]
MTRESTTVAIAGGGPAGLMLGTLLARQGVDVIVLEKHADFLRDFRGDTVHPSTIEVMHELGWAIEFLELPHRKMERVTMGTPDGLLTIADFRRLRVRSPYVAFMPQWDFLDFLVRKASAYDGFRLIRRAEVTDLVSEGGRVVGVRAETADGPLEVRAELVVSAEGRNSTLREVAGLTPAAVAPGIDVFWFRVSRRTDETAPFFQSGPGGSLVAVDRGTYWQLAYAFPKGEAEAIEARGIQAFRDQVAVLLPMLADRLDEITTFGEDIHLLSVRIDRLTQWYQPGLLFIGDAAHAMSPAGGVGINLAIQDAVAAANLIGPAARNGGIGVDVLQKVQRRRTFPATVTQRFQASVIKGLYAEDVPFFLRVLRSVPVLTRLTGRFIGLGVRPEHVAPLPE